MLQYNVVDDAPPVTDPRMQQPVGQSMSMPPGSRAGDGRKSFLGRGVLAMMIDYMICMFIWFGAFVIIAFRGLTKDLFPQSYWRRL